MPCDLNHSDDQRQILDAASAMLGVKFPVSRLRGGPHDDLAHDDLAGIAEFGAFALALPEERGGAGFTLVEEALVHVLFGRHVVSTRALATAVAARLAVALGRQEMAEKAAAGLLRICAAVPSGDTILLIDSDGADLAVVFGARRLTLLELGGQPGERATGLGQGVALTRLRPGSSATVGECSDRALLNRVDLLVSAQLLGIAEATRDLAVSYAKVRQQFGRPIGSFQAIKHHCANMAIAAEALSSLLDMAAIAERDERDDAAFQIAALRLLAPKAALANARTCIQVHGGIGFSAEADAHRYLKQAHVLRQLGSGAAMLDLAAPLAPYRRMIPKKHVPDLIRDG
jgi:alkylation response protein AidB-like acyl-CoA dehydrogenase